MEQATVETISEQELTGLLLSGIIAEAVAAVGLGYTKDELYNFVKSDIRRMHLTADEYEGAIKLLTEALEI